MKILGAASVIIHRLGGGQRWGVCENGISWSIVDGVCVRECVHGRVRRTSARATAPRGASAIPATSAAGTRVTAALPADAKGARVVGFEAVCGSSVRASVGSCAAVAARITTTVASDTGQPAWISSAAAGARAAFVVASAASSHQNAIIQRLSVNANVGGSTSAGAVSDRDGASAIESTGHATSRTADIYVDGTAGCHRYVGCDHSSQTRSV